MSHYFIVSGRRFPVFGDRKARAAADDEVLKHRKRMCVWVCGCVSWGRVFGWVLVVHLSRRWSAVVLSNLVFVAPGCDEMRRSPAPLGYAVPILSARQRCWARASLSQCYRLC